MSASKNPLIRLGHIRDEIRDLEQAFEGVTYESFSKSYVLRRSSEHGLLIISEAVKALSPAFTDHYAGVDWRAVRDIGNVLIHEYFEVDVLVLWRVVTQRLPELKRVIDLMIQDHSG